MEQEIMTGDGKIFVCCPGDAVTGGPELLHQIVHALRLVGRDAYISYLPFGLRFDCPEPYKRYDAPQATIEDTPASTVILTEVNTREARQFRRAQVMILWGSVDFFLGTVGDSKLKDALRYLRTLLFRRLPLPALRQYQHAVQSEYAADFLLRHGIASRPISDYLGEEHLKHAIGARERENIVVFNPKKGRWRTDKLRRENPDLKFVAIENMTSAQVAGLLARAKIYIDFGNHPGKDRLPREAAMAGCCIITGRMGAANFFQDVAIPERYKLNDRDGSYLNMFRPLVDAIFTDFEKHSADFDAYRAKIRREPAVFEAQIRAIFVARASSLKHEAGGIPV